MPSELDERIQVLRRYMTAIRRPMEINEQSALGFVCRAAKTAEARVEVLESAQTLRPMADVPIGETLVLARHAALGWLSVARTCDDLEFRGRQGLAWSGEYFHGWIPMPMLPDQSGEGG